MFALHKTKSVINHIYILLFIESRKIHQYYCCYLIIIVRALLALEFVSMVPLFVYYGTTSISSLKMSLESLH